MKEKSDQTAHGESTQNSPDIGAEIRVYTREVQPDCYPEGLARSVHIACRTEGGRWEPLNRNYGILFAEGRVSRENTIVPMGVRNPGFFRMEDGRIGIAGERVHEDGSEDADIRGKMLLWTTRDLIHFSECGPVDRTMLPAVLPDTLAVERSLAEEALRWWRPIIHTATTVPETIHVKSEQELDAVRARLDYSDGSWREKRVLWNKDGLCFDRPASYQVHGTITQQAFRFPLARGYGDPVLFPWEGKWYFIATNDNLNDIGLYVREADRPEDLFREGIEEHLILPFSPERGFEQTFWAPEFHVIGGELYILFAVSGHTWGPQCHMMKKKKTGRIIDEDAWEEPVRVVRKDGSPLAEGPITLDMTFVSANRGAWVIWSYREHIGTLLDSGSMLYIAPVDEREPWRLTGEPVLLTRPLYGWENVSGTINNEGPHAFVRDGKVYVTYSGGSANRYTYALGLLTADADSDLSDLRSWTKSLTPVLTFYSVKGEYGPGHNSFFVNEEGEMMIAYHAETSLTEMLRCDGIRRVHFRADGTPYFQMAQGEDLSAETVTAKVVVGEP